MIELLAPAGDLEKLKFASAYGADAIYLGGEAFGLRKASKNFTLKDIQDATEFLHALNKKIYVTLNIIPHDSDMSGLEEYVKSLDKIGVDAYIVSDPGMFSRIKKVSETAIHISTQASLTNSDTVNFWYEMGAKRVVLARELSLEEIKRIRQNTPEDLEIECFIHGAMCMSYSGRCLLSNYMTGRDANMGDCAHACRYKYSLVEEKRPGEYFPVYEDEDGTFIMNSKDLCVIEHIPELIDAGICSFKIEGRVKSMYYVSCVVNAYRKALDDYFSSPETYRFKSEYLEEIKKASYRDFTTGFYFDKAGPDAQVYETSSYIRTYTFLGKVLGYDKLNKLAKIEQRNRIFRGESVELMTPYTPHREILISEMYDENMAPIDVAPNPQQIIYIKTDIPVGEYTILRKALEDD